MKNIFNYLFYKLYQATLKGSLNDIAEYAASMYFGTLIALNFFVIVGFMAKLKLITFFFSNKYQVGLLVFICIIISAIYFLSNKRYKAIFEKYSQESKKDRIMGNTVVAIYVAISFLSIFVVAFFKSGKL